LEPGGTATVTACIDAPPSAVAGGLVFVEDQLAMNSDKGRAYWRIA
jgi:hypothetical protein